MAPKAKNAMKTKPLTKGKFSKKSNGRAPLTKRGKPQPPLTKGGKGAGSSKDKKPKAKAMKVLKGILKKKKLDKLGKMTLAEKVQHAAEGTETAEEAAANLKQLLSKQEHSKVWSKHNVEMQKKTAKERKEFDKLSKNEKGMAAAMHMVKSCVPQFMQVKETMRQGHSLDKREIWESETQMMERFGEQEFWAHVESGRVAWREDPWTYGVYNYCDKGNITKSIKVNKERQWSKSQEYTPNAEDQDDWDGLWNMDGSSHMAQVENWSKGGGKALTKGKGGAKALTKGKGKGKGKGNLLAIEDGDPDEQNKEEKTEEDQWKELLHKAKRARDQCNSARADCEAALDAAEKAKRVTKAGRKDTEDLLQKLASKVESMKQLLAKKDKAMKLEKGKKLLVDTGVVLKQVKDESKELVQLANKAGSKNSKN